MTEPASGRRGLFRMTFDALRTGDEVARDVAQAGARVDAVSELGGVMLVEADDPDSLRRIPGVLSLDRLRLNPNW